MSIARSLLLSAFLLSAVLFAHPARAVIEEIEDTHLFTETGTRSAVPGNFVVTIDPAKLPKTLPAQCPSYAALLTKSVNAAELIVRKSPPADATNIQRDQLRQSKEKDLYRVLADIAVQPVSATLTIVDAIERPAPVKPVPPKRPTPETTEEYQQALAEYEQDYAAWEKARYMVVGVMKWRSTAIMTPEDRQMIAKINDEAAAAQAEAKQKYDEARKLSTTGAREAYVAEKTEIEKTRTDALKKHKDAVNQRVPSHQTYCISGSSDILTWRRGQVRNVRGVVQKAALILHGTKPLKDGKARSDDDKRVVPALESENLTNTYVALETVIYVLSDEAGSPESTDPDAPSDSPSPPP